MAKQNPITLPLMIGEHAMIEFDLTTLEGLPEKFKSLVGDMLARVKHTGGTAFFTIHGWRLKKGETLRRGGPHIDGNYEPHLMSFGGGGWKLDQPGPPLNTDLHERQYINDKGGIVMASNFEACIGYEGDFDANAIANGGDCSHFELPEGKLLDRDRVYYGNNHFVHESLPMSEDVHRVMARITMPENHVFNPV